MYAVSLQQNRKGFFILSGLCPDPTGSWPGSSFLHAYLRLHPTKAAQPASGATQPAFCKPQNPYSEKGQAVYAALVSAQTSTPC